MGNTNPYAYNLPEEFSYTGRGWGSREKSDGLFGSNDEIYYNYDTAPGSVTDPDARAAQAAYNQLTHGDAGTTASEQQALLTMYTNRLKSKNHLGSQIATSDQLQGQASQGLMREANENMAHGLDQTRKNYARRGLLYSGARQGAEQEVRGRAGAALSSGLSSNAREFSNSKKKAQEAYAQIGLQREEESLALANQALTTATQNSIARAQAMQQFGSGLGAAAGYVAGSRNNDTQPQALDQTAIDRTGIESHWDPGQYTQPSFGSNRTNQQPAWFFGNPNSQGLVNGP